MIEENPKYHLFHKARQYDVILQPGEVLFVPAGTPHYVVNLNTTIVTKFIIYSNLGYPHKRVRYMPRHISHPNLSEQQSRFEKKNPDNNFVLG